MLTLTDLAACADVPDVPASVWEFAHTPGTRVHFGPGAVQQLSGLIRAAGLRHVLVVTDPGLVASGHVERMRGSLHAAGVRTTLFAHVIENPTTETVEACRVMAATAHTDGFVGIGGGSSLDTAKGANFLLTNGGEMRDYWGMGRATQPMHPLFAVPTTAGTGSEVQSFALISEALTHAKMACGDPKAAPIHAVLDPELTLSLPPRVTALTGIDALAHAIESLVCTKSTLISQACSRAAFALIAPGLPRVLQSPGDLTARSQMLVGAALAGMAIENSMLGAAHSAANPLTAHFGLVHGAAVGVMLPHVIRFNRAHSATAAAQYQRLSPHQPLEEMVTELLRAASLPVSLRDVASESDLAQIPILAAEAAAQWTARFNPAPLTAADFKGLYSDAMGGTPGVP
jgi:alcohol dehydrogenase